ncbi:hypothetical protein EJ08DRAFT_732396 [Tothia fuscella]|uniref:Uncharacterized protein n=1 Tax=Tothia fuscella TaxID=1048955 RepID=A0A9P4U0D7_9PEZI|nr:hypothetical protein EJ08DRAFT_732396 [Tothia fuscella]
MSSKKKVKLIEPEADKNKSTKAKSSFPTWTIFVPKVKQLTQPQVEKAPQDVFAIMKLPAEIRNIIYAFYFRRERPVEVTFTVDEVIKDISNPLLAACRVIRYKALFIYFNCNPFYIELYCYGPRFFRFIGAYGRSALREIILQPYGEYSGRSRNMGIRCVEYINKLPNLQCLCLEIELDDVFHGTTYGPKGAIDTSRTARIVAYGLRQSSFRCLSQLVLDFELVFTYGSLHRNGHWIMPSNSGATSFKTSTFEEAIEKCELHEYDLDHSEALNAVRSFERTLKGLKKIMAEEAERSA